MDIAYSLLDRKAYSAQQFFELQPRDRETLRHRLSCTGCAAPAFFRGGSHSAGRQPCFGARPHRAGCSLATLDLSPRKFDAQGPGSCIDDPYEAVILNMAPRPVSTSCAGEIDTDIDARTDAEWQMPVPEGASRTTCRRPSTILRALQTTESFQWSNQLIAIPGGPFVPMREFLVPFDRVHPMLERVIRGWWGTVSSVGVDPCAQVWLNSGEQGCLTCPMGPEIANEVLRRAGVQWDDVEALVGASLLVIGEMRISHSGIPVCGVKSAEHVALILA